MRYFVKSRRPNGRRRAGRFFSRKGEVVDLNDKELAAVMADRLLVATPEKAGTKDTKQSEPKAEPKSDDKK